MNEYLFYCICSTFGVVVLSTSHCVVIGQGFWKQQSECNAQLRQAEMEMNLFLNLFPSILHNHAKTSKRTVYIPPQKI